MLTRHTCDNITWINLTAPTPQEVRSLVKEFDIHPLVAQELLSPTLRPKVDAYKKYLYLILHFPSGNRIDGTQTEHEIDFIVGKNFLITTRYQAVDTEDAIDEIFAPKNVFPPSGVCEPHAGLLFYKMIKRLYHHVNTELDEIYRELKLIEQQIFEGEEHEMVVEISEMARRLLDLRVATMSHGSVLESFERAGESFFRKDFHYYLGAITAEYYHVFSLLESSHSTLRELRETNDSLLNTKTNDIMRVLTILAFVTFPLSLVASVFGMNTKVLPVVGRDGDFWIIVGGMILATFIFFAFFKYKKWL